MPSRTGHRYLSSICQVAALITGCSGVIGPSGKPALASSTSLLPAVAAAAARFFPGLTSGVAAAQAHARSFQQGEHLQTLNLSQSELLA
jgi:hypothetical protein